MGGLAQCLRHRRNRKQPGKDIKRAKQLTVRKLLGGKLSLGNNIKKRKGQEKRRGELMTKKRNQEKGREAADSGLASPASGYYRRTAGLKLFRIAAKCNVSYGAVRIPAQRRRQQCEYLLFLWQFMRHCAFLICHARNGSGNLTTSQRSVPQLLQYFMRIYPNAK